MEHVGTRDIEGKVTRVGASECGQRTSFNQSREAGDSVWETELCGGQASCTAPIVAGIYLNARLGLAPHPEKVYDWV